MAQSSETVDLESYFIKHGILESCPDTDDLCLTESFETAWFDEIEPLKDAEITTSEVADAFGVEQDAELDLVTRGEARYLQSDSGQISQWPSRPALVADIAASRVLQAWLSNWNTFDPARKGRFLNSLRMFLETCPTTGGDIQIGEVANPAVVHTR